MHILSIQFIAYLQTVELKICDIRKDDDLKSLISKRTGSLDSYYLT